MNDWKEPQDSNVLEHQIHVILLETCTFHGTSLVFLDVLNPTTLVTQPFRRSIPAQLLDETLSRPAHIELGKVYHVDAFQYQVVGLHGIRRSERRAEMQNNH